MLFSRDNKITYPHPLRMSNIEIGFSTETKYRGITLDNRLTWNKHFDNITSCGKKYLMQIMTTVNNIWGPKPYLTKWISTTIIRPRISYTSMVWSHTGPS